MSTPTFIINLPPRPSASPEPQESPRQRPKKRNQVARACDWCRVHRVRCDNVYPCSNCRKRGGECSNNRPVKLTTVPQAYREIERLRQRVQELELELQQEKEHHTDQPRASSSARRGESEDASRHRLPDLAAGPAKKVWEGIHISTARSPNKTWFGPSSLFYFIGRINSFLTTALKQSHSPQRMMLSSTSTLLDGPATVLEGSQAGRTAIAPTYDPIRGGESLTPTQEEYFLNLFWQSYYPSYPILDELEFKAHYQSLWATSDKERKPSALVDIVLAMCMQYGMAQLPGGRQGLAATSRDNSNYTDSTIAGRWHYRRCLSLLSGDMESPTISTLQCHILCAVYLCYGSFQNMSDNACGLAVRTAFMLGLHLEPPQNMPRRERELRKRLWWTLYMLESQRSMKLGRPFTIHDSAATCSLPADDREIAMISGSSFAPIGENVTWLTWNLQNTKLVLAARRAYTTFYDQVPDAFSVCEVEPITKVMEEWRKNVPEALKTKRQNHGVPLSTDQSALDIEPFTPVWLQRQRLLLELSYHNLCTSLYRPSICFALAGAPAALTDHAASTCAAHAMALTHIMHQVLTSTSILEGWHEAFQWQWNVAMTLIGFMLACPHGTLNRAARRTIDLSVAAFEIFGNSFAVAASAAAIMRELVAKVDLLMEEHLRKNAPQQNPTPPVQVTPVATYEHPNPEPILPDGNSISADMIDWPSNLGNETTAEIGGVLGQTIDISAENFFSDLDWSGIGSNMFDQWVLMQQDIHPP